MRDISTQRYAKCGFCGQDERDEQNGQNGWDEQHRSSGNGRMHAVLTLRTVAGYIRHAAGGRLASSGNVT